MQIVGNSHQRLFQTPSKSRKVIINGLMIAALTMSCQSNARAESPSMAPIQMAQAPPQFIPTDVTPFTVNPERNNFNPGYKFKLFQVLPERLWFNLSTETSQRLDTNVLFTANNPKADYVFRVLPNVTVGYNIAKNTSVYVNYFVIKDTFATHGFLNAPTTQSLSWGIQHNKRLGDKTTLQYNAQARELWQAQGLHQFDFIPGMTLIHSITPKSVIFASTLLQLRGGQYFVAPTREIDPFYTLGYLHMHGPWTFIATDTLVTNFRHGPFNDSIPKESNVSMIADFEVNRPVAKGFPSLLAFVRAEPIFNWDSHKAPGLSGFDFRLYSGLRFIASKPSYFAQTQNLKKQLMNQENNSKFPNGTTPPNAPAPSSTTPAPTSSEAPNPVNPDAAAQIQNSLMVPLRSSMPSSTLDGITSL